MLDDVSIPVPIPFSTPKSDTARQGEKNGSVPRIG